MSGADRAALGASTDQVLALLAAKRAEYGEADAVLVAGCRVAGNLRVQFRGRDKENARVLAAASEMLADLAAYLAGKETAAELVPDALLMVLGFTADDLNRGDDTRLEETTR